MADRQEFTFPSADGVHAVHAVRWLPEGSPRGTVQLVHGISEYILRYDAFARFLAGHGFVVTGHDHLGHGLTARGEEEYGFLAEKGGWDLLCRDVRALSGMTAAAFPGLPRVLLGHSMGSFVVRTCLIRYPDITDLCILSGTGQESAALVGAGKALCTLLCALRSPRYHSPLVTRLSLGAYNRQFRPNRTGADWICRDEAVVDAYVADPLCSFFPSVGMTRDMMQGLAFIARPENLRRMNASLPVLFFSGDADPVGGSGAGVKKVVRLFREAGMRDVTLKLYPGGRHEMLNETNRDEVYADVLAWMDSRLPG